MQNEIKNDELQSNAVNENEESKIATIQRYAKTAIDAFPLLLNPETKEAGAIRVYCNLGGMLDVIETKEELAVFAYALAECREFACENNLTGLRKLCAKWNADGLKIEKKFNDLEQQKSIVNVDNEKIVTGLQHMLRETHDIIHKTGQINTNDYTAVGHRLDEIELYINNNGRQYLTDFQFSTFMREINNQRFHLERAISFFKSLEADLEMLR